MNSEFKISSIIRSQTIVTVIARFYETTVTDILVTSDNYELYPGYQPGDMVQEVSRIRYSPEFEYLFPGTTTDEQIHDFLYKEALQYGTPIN